MAKIIEYLKNPWKVFGTLAARGFFDNMSDAQYLKYMYRARMNKNLDLENPKTFNEKLQWLKLNDRNPLYTRMVDKYEAKIYVSEKIGEQYIIPTIGVWETIEDVDFNLLPKQFVLKCNHNSGLGMYICTDKSQMDVVEIKRQLKKGLEQNYYKIHREWCYKDVSRKIIAEEFIGTTENDLIDYKFMCFNGKVECSFTCSNRYSEDGLNVTFFDREWNKLPFERHYSADKKEIEKPKSYDEMIRLAECLAEGLPFVRVDFYEVDARPLFGELTFYPGAGFEEFNPQEWDRKLGDFLQLPKLKH